MGRRGGGQPAVQGLHKLEQGWRDRIQGHIAAVQPPVQWHPSCRHVRAVVVWQYFVQRTLATAQGHSAAHPPELEQSQPTNPCFVTSLER